MSGITLANAGINSLLPSTQQVDVQPSEEDSIFVFTATELEDIITRATQPLQARVDALEATIDQQNDKIASLEATQEKEMNRIALDIAFDRQRISKLEQKEPQPLQRDRGEILLALLSAHGGKMLAKEARNKLRLSKSLFSQLLATMKNDIEVKPYYLNKNWKVLVLK